MHDAYANSNQLVTTMTNPATKYLDSSVLMHTILPVVCEILRQRRSARIRIRPEHWAACAIYWTHGTDTDTDAIAILRAITFSPDEWVAARLSLDTGTK
jgi:hypothetical protein